MIAEAARDVPDHQAAGSDKHNKELYVAPDAHVSSLTVASQPTPTSVDSVNSVDSVDSINFPVLTSAWHSFGVTPQPPVAQSQPQLANVRTDSGAVQVPSNQGLDHPAASQPTPTDTERMLGYNAGELSNPTCDFSG
jgi:hypothetical protein